MPPNTTKTTGNSLSTDTPIDDGSPFREDSAELLVSGTELSSEGLDELAALLLRLGRPNEGRKNRRSERK